MERYGVSLCTVQKWENADQNNSEYRHVLRSEPVVMEWHICGEKLLFIAK